MKHYYLKILLSLLITLFFSEIISAQSSKLLWTKISKESFSKSQLVVRKSEPIKALYYKLDVNALKNILQCAPQRKGFTGVSNVIVGFPNADGSLESFRVLEAPVMHSTLQARHPNLRSYVGQSIENPSTLIRFSITPQGLHSMTLSSNKGAQYIDPYSKNDNSYIIYFKKDLPELKDEFICEVIESISAKENKTANDTKAFNANDGMMHDFRLALASTMEYSEFHWMAAGLTMSDTDEDKKAAVLAAMVVTMNRVNGLFERDLSITMTIIANNENIIFVGNPDPYTNNNGSTMLGQNQSEIDDTIGTANYDLGHVFSTGGGGIAGLGIVCNDAQKARGVTGLSTPVGDAYDIDFVAHEIGHQFGANHTFNGNTGNCTGGNRNASTAYEPGSGSTIMAYAGICSPQNVQSNSDVYFHQESLSEIWTFISGTSCEQETPTGNGAPTAMAGSDYTIPISTPYKLTGSSSDTETTSTHTFTWEQYDLGDSGLPTEGDLSGGPLVRTFEGTTDPVRSIPRLTDVINDCGISFSTTWEKLASVSRDINFQLTVRDNDIRGGQTDSDGMLVTTVAAAGPFTVTSQATTQIIWTPGANETINWDVAGTNANGVDTANVNILLSSDGGVTFDRVLASNTENDGTHDIVVPSDITSTMCRVMVEGAGNIFYAVNCEFFAVGNYTYEPGEVCNDYVFNFGIAIPLITDGMINGYGMTVNDSETITDVNINVNMTHNDVGDIDYGFGVPFEAASVVNVLTLGNCSGAVDVNLTFDDDGSSINCASTANGDVVSPVDPLSVANGTDSNGQWIFWMRDDVDNGVNGVLNSVTLTICHEELVLTLGVNDIAFDDSFSVFPNPNHGEFTVKLNSNSGKKINISVYDIRGRRVFDNIYQNSSNFKEIVNLNNVQSGMYILMVSDGERSSTKKIIVN